MTYTKHTWVEYTGTGANKATWMNNMETQYDEVVSYYTTTLHDSSYYTESEAAAMFFAPTYDGAGSGFVADTLDGYTAADIIGSAVPSGTIVIWGSSGALPSGWKLCNGLNGTPNLCDVFPVAAGNTYTLGQTGGYATVSSSAKSVTIGTHALTITEMPAHTHPGIIDYNDTQATGVTAYADNNGAPDANTAYTGNTGSGTAHGHPSSSIAGSQGTTGNNLPAFIAYRYIMKE